MLHAAAILACAAMAGAAAAHVGQVRDRLGQANRDLTFRNRQLADALRAQEAARHEQDLALAQIRGAEKRYRRLLERVQDAVLVIQDGRLVYANPALATMMGESPSVLLGLDVQSLVPAAYRGELWEQYRRWEAGQVSEAFETRLATRKGEAVLVSVQRGRHGPGGHSARWWPRCGTSAASGGWSGRSRTARAACRRSTRSPTPSTSTSPSRTSSRWRRRRRGGWSPFDRLAIALVATPKAAWTW